LPPPGRSRGLGERIRPLFFCFILFDIFIAFCSSNLPWN